MLEGSRVPGRFWVPGFGIWFRENSPPKPKSSKIPNRPVGYHLSSLMAAIRTGWEFIVGKCGHDLVNLYLAKHGGTLLSTLLKSSESYGFEAVQIDCLDC